MQTKDLVKLYRQDIKTQSIISKLENKAKLRLHLQGLYGSADSFVTSAVYLSDQKNHVFILADKDSAAYFQNDLEHLLEKKDILFFPDSFKRPGHLEAVNKSNVLLRTETLSKLALTSQKGEVLITYPEALFEKVVDTSALSKNTINIKNNEEIDVDFMIEILIDYGFDRTDFVYEPGQFSVRGGIVDIYSFGNDLPYRIELFGEEVESIRIFDPLSQLSERKLSSVRIVPNIQTQFSSNEKVSLFQLLPEDCVVWIEDMERLIEVNQKCYDQAIALIDSLKNTEPSEEDIYPLLKDEQARYNFVNSENLVKHLLDYPIIEFGQQAYFKEEKIDFHTEEQMSFQKNFNLLVKEFQKNTKAGVQNILFAGSPRQANRFRHIFNDLDAELTYTLTVDAIHQGFKDHNLKIACYTDHQIFNRYYKYNIKQGYSKDKAMTVKLLQTLQPGDFVTHIDHGVGKYSGLETIEVNGKKHEAMRIIYQNNDKLYVHINSLHKVTRYIGKEGKAPRINKLGSDTWQKLKRKTKRKIKDIAKDLIKLYAKRKASKGFAFAPDTYLQDELEASFIYEDTPDQAKATLDVKKDMEALAPMDRLICGDVGFGKTEIAVRAACKAVADSKQVAILVPTTILALQHYRTFKERLSDFPAEVDYLNRFKTKRQKTHTLKKLEDGEVDIIIGTHALLSKGVKFKNLGLLVIDEEQKFGVAAKEKLRNIKVDVDTLTLTATPIPRTLQFSLMSARDLSVINTPPPNRQPVHTELIRFEEGKIRDAINYEVYRGGQVFFIHNRVKDLVEVAAMIKRLCPDVDVGMAHGQLENKLLEERMMKFIRGQYDVLVCTNIVESGLDVSNANTIIINNAQNFGLSDLHQLRGRVGRSNKKAFCYLVSPALYLLPDDSKKRLKAIEQYSDLGSGFQISMRDLDIRGAGNLLGGEQSGFIADIGFEMYQKILNEAIVELKESDFKEVFKQEILENKSFVSDCQVDTDLEILFPMEYIQNSQERLSLYTKLDNIKTEEDLLIFSDELKDRFGPYPTQVKELLDALRLRWLAIDLGFEHIVLKSQKLRCYFVANKNAPYYESPTFSAILGYIQKNHGKAHFKQTHKYLMMIFEQIPSIQQALICLQGVKESIKL